MINNIKKILSLYNMRHSSVAMTARTRTCIILQCMMMIMTVVAQTQTPAPSPTNNTSFPNMTMSEVPTLSPMMSEMNETLAPTRVPTDAPVVLNTTAPSVSRSPSMAPSPNATAMPSDVRSNAPTAVASANPTTSPKPVPLIPEPTKKPTKKPTGAPSAMPSNAATEPPVATQNVNVAIDNIQITFRGVSTIPPADLLALQSIMEEWYEAYFNVEIDDTARRYLYEPRHRKLQFRVPAVRNMNTVVDVTGQDTVATSGSNTVTYTQNLDYDKTSDARAPEDYALLPFVDTTYKNELFDRLQSEVGSFADLTTISTPVIADPPKEEESSGGLSLPVIIGIVAGGVVGLLLLACGAYALGSRRDARYPVGDGVGAGSNNHSNLNSGGYNSADDHDLPPSTFQMSIGDDDVISTMDDPTVAKLSNTMSGGEASALGGYGDQSVATVDYDYSKAYGGGGDTSVVSSVGGTLGDATRQTAGEVAAGRLALGASYDDNIRDSSRLPREQIIVVEAPSGKLGVVIDTPDDGAPVVHAVKDTSVIASQIQVGDKLIKVDDEDVRSMTAIKVSKLISKKSANPVRRLTIVRTYQS